MGRRSPHRHRAPTAWRLAGAALSAVLLATLSAVVGVAQSAGAADQLGVITAYTEGISHVTNGITAGPDGNVWFTEEFANRIGRITTSGVVTEFSAGIPTGAHPAQIVAGSDGNLWFTEPGTDEIGRITTAGVVTEFSAGISSGADPDGIAAGPDGNLWFTEPGISGVARITTAGVVTQFTTGITVGSGPTGITAGPQGDLWFTEYTASQIGRITTAGVVTQFSAGVNPGDSGPFQIAAGADGNLWYTEIVGGRIGRLTPTGVVTEFTSGLTPVSNPEGIAAGPDGNVWFTQDGPNGPCIGRITPAGAVQNSLTIPAGEPGFIAAGPDGNMWFTQPEAVELGRIGTAGTGQVPSSPTYVTGSEGPEEVTVTWAASAYDGMAPITSYTAMASPGGKTCTWSTGPYTCTVHGLTDWSAYTFTVVATNVNGASLPSSPSPSVTPVPTGPIGKVTLYPDTSTGEPTILGPITAGNNGDLYFSSGLLVQATTAGVEQQCCDGVYAVAAGAGDTLWFTLPTTDQIASYVSGSLTAYALTLIAPDAAPTDIAAGPDGNMWFTEPGTGQIGRITPSGTVTEFSAGISAGASPEWITAGPDGAMWFTEEFTHTVGRITTTGVVTQFSAGITGYPGPITVGPDGNVWFTISDPSGVVRITPTGTVSEFTAGYTGVPFGVATGCDGNLWTADGGSRIARVTPTGTVVEFDRGLSYTTGVGEIGPTFLAAGPDGGMWFSGGGFDPFYDRDQGWFGEIGTGPSACVPDAPTGVSGVGLNAAVAVTWAAPPLDGLPVTAYTVTATPGGATCKWTSGPLSCTVSGLKDTTPYTFTVTATDSVGTGPSSVRSAAVTPHAVTLPGAPASVSAAGWYEQATVSWTAPSSGTSPVTSYTVTASPGGAQCFWFSGPLSCAVLGLADGTAYTFTVTATSAVGTGPPSAASNSVTPEPGKPGPVTRVLTDPGNGQVTVTWWPPVDDGGSTITDYTVTASPGGNSCTGPWNPFGCTIYGLTNGVAYTFSIVATNAYGNGPAVVVGPVTPGGAPGPPTDLVATPGDGEVVLNWTAPANDGGASIEGYEIYEGTSPGGESATPVNASLVSATTYTVRGLVNDVTYYFTVDAVSALGQSSASNQASATPSLPTVPAAPTGLVARGGNGHVTLTWTVAPGFVGYPVLGYDVFMGTSPGGESATPVNATLLGGTTDTVGGLVNGTTYYFTVKALNALGASAPSAEASATATAGGYDLVGSDGGVFVFPVGQPGGFYGSLPGLDVTVSNIVGIVPSSDYKGYFLVGSDGGVFSFGDTTFEGSLPGLHVSVADIVGIVPTNDDKGYFLVGSDGGVFCFGDAPFLGSLPGQGVSVSDIIGIAATPDNGGYWIVSATGTVYAFGDAATYGSATVDGAPVTGIASTPDGKGYWIVFANGDVQTFGDATNYGDLPALGVVPVEPVEALVPTSDALGYWLIGADGGVFSFGDAVSQGSLPGLGVHVTDVVGAVPTLG